MPIYSKISIFLGVALFLLVVYFVAVNSDEEKVPDDEVLCTLEAKLCPDGSYVGRVAPDCQFEACPR